MTLPANEPPVDELHGLDEAEALKILSSVGPNRLVKPRTRGLTEIVASTLREPMFLFLIGAATLYLAVGDLAEGMLLVGGAVISIGLVVIQDARSERALAALQELAEPFARVVRGGAHQKIAAHLVVPGDLLLVAEGDRVPADARLLSRDILVIDESILTGESVPVAKSSKPLDEHPDMALQPGGENSPFLFAGTMVVRGQGLAKVVRTGAKTSLGQIGASLASIQSEPTPLQQTTGRVVFKLGFLSAAMCLIVIAAYGVFRRDWMEGALAGITLAISMIPEEFPMVLAIFLAIGSRRLARKKVLVRTAAVIETLGAATVLCVDKTGTLTENRMALAAFWIAGRHGPLNSESISAEAARLISLASLASAVQPIDPMDRAIRRSAEPLPIPGNIARNSIPSRTNPLRKEMLAVIQAWQMDPKSSLVAAKGAPEAISRLCRMDEGKHRELQASVSTMAGDGLRVLGVASRLHSGDPPEDLSEGEFAFEGLVGFVDPLRAEVPAAIDVARQAGISVAMITGDYPATALEIARRAGIETADGVLTGSDIASIDPSALRNRIEHVRVFARIIPEQKLALVQAFKANGEVVAMTGDGVALEAAHVGIAMGERGTDVAKEAADIVLLNDSFASIIEGVALGRRIFSNLRKALTYITAIHVPIAGLALFPIVLGWPPMLYPMHVVLLELVIDPVCSLVFESEPAERNAMTRPPRSSGDSLFGTPQIMLGILQGAAILAAVIGLYGWAVHNFSAGEARSIAFVGLVSANLVLAFADSAELGTAFFDARRIVFWLIGAIASTILAIIFAVPEAARIFRMSVPGVEALAIALLVGLLAGGWYGFLQRAGLLQNKQSLRRTRPA